MRGAKRSDELRRRIYKITNAAGSESITFSNDTSTPFFATRFARRSMGASSDIIVVDDDEQEGEEDGKDEWEPTSSPKKVRVGEGHIHGY